ncbi:MAG: 30S ribosomal protein S6, partial [Candidatus Ancillula sp.]|nr:30S ribosomal protein S6 [Candidatus Ancillula sp.]
MSKPNVAGSVNSYEVAVIFSPDLDDKKAAALLDKYLEIVTSEGGTID